MTLNVTVWRHPGKPPLSLPSRQVGIPVPKPQRPASWRSSREPDFGAVWRWWWWGGVPFCSLLGSISLVQGEHAMVASRGLRGAERSCFCFLETRDQGVWGRQSPSQGHFLVAWCPRQRQPELGPHSHPQAGDHPWGPAAPALNPQRQEEL